MTRLEVGAGRRERRARGTRRGGSDERSAEVVPLFGVVAMVSSMSSDRSAEDDGPDTTVAPQLEGDEGQATGVLDRLTGRVHGVRSRVARRTGGEQLWRLGIAVVGLVVILVGVFSVVLPGPGWVTIFVGLGIWATEFAWAGSVMKSAPAALAKVHGMAEATPFSVSCAWPLKRARGRVSWMVGRLWWRV